MEKEETGGRGGQEEEVETDLEDGRREEDAGRWGLTRGNGTQREQKWEEEMWMERGL